MTPVARYVLGPTVSYTSHTDPADGKPAEKGDVVVALGTPPIGNDAAGKPAVSVIIPAYDLATTNKLCEVRAYLVPGATTPPGDVDGYVKSDLPVAVATVEDQQGGVEVGITLPDVPVGPYLCRLVLGFDK